MLTDNYLLLASGGGDREAFTVLVERHHRAVIHFVHRFLATADRATAEDLAQQVFLNAWRYAPTFEPRAKVLTWLFRLATNTCLNYRRSERSRVSAVLLVRAADAAQGAGGRGAEAHLEEAEQAQQVRAAVASLPPKQRAAIVLRYFHDFSYEQIGDILGASTSAVDSMLHRARPARPVKKCHCCEAFLERACFM